MSIDNKDYVVQFNDLITNKAPVLNDDFGRKIEMYKNLLNSRKDKAVLDVEELESLKEINSRLKLASKCIEDLISLSKDRIEQRLKDL